MSENYAAVHKWVRKHKPKPEFCEICFKAIPTELMNIDHKCKRKIEDFKWACKKCHQKYDFETFGSRGPKIRTKCPKCETERDIKGTPERVRCPKCSFRYYVKKNIIVPKSSPKKDEKKEKGTTSGQQIITPHPGWPKENPPDPINILFDNLDKSITSVWGPRPSGKNKWDAKYTMWLAFKKWFEGGNL